MYDDGFLRFCSWAAEQAFDPFDPFAAQVALLSRTHGLPQTIQGYSSSKPSVPSRFGKGPIWCITTSLPLILYPQSMELERPRLATDLLPGNFEWYFRTCHIPHINHLVELLSNNLLKRLSS